MFKSKDEFIDQLRKRGYEGDIKNYHLLIFTTHGFNINHLDELADLGYDNLTFDDLKKICFFDIQPDYIRELQKLGFSDLSFKRIVEMCIHNVLAGLH